MKDLSLQIKGLIAKASSSEKPNGDKKKSPAEATAASPKTDGGSIYFPVGTGPQGGSFNPGNRTSEKSGTEEGRLVIGSGVSLKGNIERCKTLEVHGEVEAEIECDRLVIDEGGTLKGSVIARTAEISGALSGTARVQEKVMIRFAGHFSGKLSCGAIRIELGGLVRGELEEIAPNSKVEVVPEVLNPKPQSTQLQEKLLEIENMDREITAIRTGAQS